MPTLVDGQTLRADQFPSLFKELLTSVLTIFQGEQMRTQDSGSEVVPQLIQEFISYAYNKEPFSSHKWTREVKPLKWWTQLSRDSNARLLAVRSLYTGILAIYCLLVTQTPFYQRVAVKIFSISPSEICDERTASRLGWFNAARRSSMTPEHLVDSAKLYEFYVNGFTDGTSTHTAHVHLSKVTPSSSSTPAIHSAPSLMDLLNTNNIEPQDDTAAMEQLWFNNPDPYDLAETDSDRIHPDLKLQPEENIIRSSTRFDIAYYVKLNDSKLTDLISNVDMAGPGASVMESIAVQATPVGKPGEWSVASFLDTV